MEHVRRVGEIDFRRVKEAATWIVTRDRNNTGTWTVSVNDRLHGKLMFYYFLFFSR